MLTKNAQFNISFIKDYLQSEIVYKVNIGVNLPHTLSRKIFKNILVNICSLL